MLHIHLFCFIWYWSYLSRLVHNRAPSLKWLWNTSERSRTIQWAHLYPLPSLINKAYQYIEQIPRLAILNLVFLIPMHFFILHLTRFISITIGESLPISKCYINNIILYVFSAIYFFHSNLCLWDSFKLKWVVQVHSLPLM